MSETPSDQAAGYRYGLVLGFTAAAVVFMIVAPNDAWARATAVGLQGLATLCVAGVATGALGTGATTVLGALVGIGVPAALAGGLVRRRSSEYGESSHPGDAGARL